MTANDAAFLVESDQHVEAQFSREFVQRDRTPAFSFADTPLLTQALRAGDEGAFSWLHRSWNTRLVRYCLALTGGDAAAASEVAQATYVRIFRHIRPLPDETALWSWMTCAARSAACDRGRTSGRYRRAIARFGEWLQRRRSVAEESCESALVAALDAALNDLSSEERALIEARYFERVPLSEIATRCATSTRGIEGRLARVRVRLRKSIARAIQQRSHGS